MVIKNREKSKTRTTTQNDNRPKTTGQTDRDTILAKDKSPDDMEILE